MKARGIGSLIGMVVLTIGMALGARSCTGEPASSPAQPSNLARNGVAGLCANQQAVDDNGGGGGSAQQLLAGVGSSAGVPGGSNALRQALGGAPSCATTTSTPGP
ncbi:MAG TPA: hypothetical protein VFA11_17615 [Acidimicrobiales bacterium]|nr:hypothetical protein [Acidimicrobiales bacterium]